MINSRKIWIFGKKTRNVGNEKLEESNKKYCEKQL
jgi:hypothetical protein